MPSDAANRWTEFYTKSTEMMYPAEAVIRIFKGTYPNLKMPKPKAGDWILDVGCGDGRHFPLFHSLGMNAVGLEITEDIALSLAARMEKLGIRATFGVGTCASMPWGDATFDYLLTWNSCYYMGPDGKFEDHVAEMARVIKPGGWIVCSIPKATCFIFDGCDPVFVNDDSQPDLVVDRVIRNDYFGLRNGERLRCFFGDGSNIKEAFGSHFTNFCHASIDIDMFGLAYNWHVFTAERRT